MMADIVDRFVDAQNSLVVQHSDFSLRAVYDMAVAGSIDLEPHYQRRDRWRPTKQSALIESFILNVPVPPVYLSEEDFGYYSVIDGKQRLTAIRDFLSGRLKLTGLTGFPELEGCYYEDLPAPIQNALSVRPYIRVITLLRQTDPHLKYEVFLRLNTGGEKLLAQEIRNVAYSGRLNDLLFELSTADFLRQQLKISGSKSKAYQRMDDVEHVLRFFTVAARWEDIGQVPSREMDTFMRENRNPEAEGLEQLRAQFTTALDGCRDIWGREAFHKPVERGWRDQLISPLYDAEMVAVSRLSADELASVVARRKEVVRAFVAKYKDDETFERSVSQSTNNPTNVKYRIGTVEEILRDFC